MMDLRTSLLRKAILLTVGAVLIAEALIYKASLAPSAAPDPVQESGKAIARQELRKLLHTPFGQSTRGSLILNEIQKLLDNDIIVFSADLNGPRGSSWRTILGHRTIYVKVLEMNNGRYLHQLPWQITEVLAHEALHSIKGGVHGASTEEECDAFAAGECAEAASRGIKESLLLTVDGLPLAQFVERAYADIDRDPNYEPVGESLEWLIERTGLTRHE